MKHVKLFGTAFLLFLLFGAAAKEIKVDSKIDAVTVFTQGAQLFRTANVTLEKGEHLLVFRDLTTDFDPSTIRVGGTGQLTILSVSSRTNYAEPPKQTEEVEALRNSLNSILEEIEDLNALNSVYAEEEDLLLKNKQLAGSQTGVDVNQLKQAADYFRVRLTEIKTKRLEVGRSIKKKQEESNTLRNQISQISGKRGKTTGEIMVKIAVDQPTKANFELTYFVNNAGWTPFYDVRVTGVDKAIQVEYKAKVQQQTGVEWKNVDLTLSSGNPSRNGTLPNLNPWYIDFVQAYAQTTPRGGGKASSELYIESDMMEVQDDAEIQYNANANYADQKAIQNVSSVVSTTLLNFEYAISLPYTIASGGNPEDVAVRTVEVPANFEYRANIKLDKSAYLVAKLYNWQDFNLLNGNAKLFNEGTFVGEIYLDIENTSDTLLLSLGQDDNIVLKRERLVDVNGTQFMGSSKKETRFWQTTIRNNKKQQVRLVLTEQIPVSRQKDISVKLEEAEGAVLSENTGYVVWHLNLAPAETKEVKLGYSVKYPKDKTLTFYD